MKNIELQQMSTAELEAHLQDARKSYLSWREDIMSGKEANYSRLRDMRRIIARIETALRLQTKNS